MSDKAMKALEERKKRQEEEEEQQNISKSYENSKSKVDAALSARKQRISSDIGYITNDISSRYKSVVDSYNSSVSTPLWGKSASDIYDSQRENMLAVNNLMRDVEAYRNYLDNETVDSMLKSLSQIKTGQQNIYTNAEVFSQYQSEEEFNSALEEYQKQLEEQKKLTGGYDPIANQEEGKAGWEEYVATKEEQARRSAELAAQREAEEEAKRSDANFFEWLWDVYSRANATGSSTSDTSLPIIHNTNEMAEEYQRNELEKNRPDDRWTDEQRYTYGYLWNTERQKASQYAYYVNTALDNQAEYEKLEKIKAMATDNFGAGALHTAGAILTAPLGLADYLGDIIAYGSLGYIPDADGEITPYEYSQAATGGISQTLNDGGVFDEDIPVIGGMRWGGVLDKDIPVIGGKGLGDAYGLGVSIAQSSLAASTGGGGQALVTFFGSAAASGVDDALSRGATGGQAIAYGTMAGLAEALAEQVGVDNLLKIGASSTMRELVWNIVKQGAAEGLEEGLTTLMNNFSDQLVLQDKSNFNILVERYISQGMYEGDAKKQAWIDMVNDMAFDMLGGFVSGAIHAVPKTTYHTIKTNTKMKSTYGSSQQELVGEALDIDPGNAFAQQMQSRLDSGKNLSGSQLNRLVQQNETALKSQDITAIQSAAESRLTEFGETGDVKSIAAAIAKQAAGQKLSHSERKAISDSKYAKRVSDELSPENIRSGEYSSEWTGKIDTQRINVDEYSRLVEAAQLPNETTEVTGEQVDTETPKKKELTPQNISDGSLDSNVGANSASNTQSAGNYIDHISSQNTTDENVRTAAPETEASTEREQQIDAIIKEINELNRQEEYIRSMLELYGEEGTKYWENPEYIRYSDMLNGIMDKKTELRHIRSALIWGYDVSEILGYTPSHPYVQQYAQENATQSVDSSNSDLDTNVESTSQTQKKTSSSGQESNEKASSNTEAKKLDAKSKNVANGKTGRRKGTVKGEGVTIADLKKTFNDPQGKAYKYLSTVAEVTGIDIVLYRSEANQDGEFQGAQGRYSRSDPGTIYIDLNAGLSDIKSADDLAKYAMLRTFAHEFTHFIENWNPIQYNELRKVVFDSLTERGENVNDLIEEKQARNPGMDYDKASREVVAEAMTDILPDANFVQELAENHRTIFQKLLDNLKEFVDNLRNYYNSIGHNPSKEANALKEQVGDTIKYLDSIVQLFDKAAVQAVENYQQTVATEEVAVAKTETTTTDTTTVSKTESVATTEEKSPVVETDAYGFTISDNVEHGSLEITFDGKPSETVRNTLKDNKFRWNKAKKVWYGYGDRADITNALRAAYELETDTAKPVESVIEHRTPAEPAPVAQTPEPAAETVYDPSDPYVRLAGLMGRRSRFEHGNFVYRILKAGPDNSMWQARIDAADVSVSGVYVANARGIHYTSELYENRDDAIEDIIATARASKLLDEKPAETTKPKEEVTANVENVDNRGTVQQPVTDRQGDPRVLDEVETGDVQGDERTGNSVESAGERGQQTVRNDNLSDAERDVGGSSEGSSQGGDIRGTDRVTSEDPAAEKLHEEVAEQIAQQSTEKPKGRNFVIGDSLDLPSGEKSRYKANVEAIRLVKQLEAEGRYATEAEQVILSKYVGWGGLANAFDQRKTEWAKEFAELKELLTDEEYSSARGSTLNAHYTDISVIKAMYDGLKQLGFTGGRMMEPSSGVGNFVGAMPADMAANVRSWTMVELDGITGLIAKYLYPNADVRIQGFEKANIPNNFMDVAISNVPFGNYAIADKSYPKNVTSAIHNYFFAKSLDKVRPGGIVMFITSSYTMNSKDSAVRRYIMQKADLLGAIRLPDSAFKGNAGTEVVTDILVLKKRAANTNYAGEDFLESPYQYISGYNGAYINSYFANHPEMVLGTPSMDGGMYRGGNLTYKAFTDRGSLADQIREAFKNIQGKMEYPAKQSPEKTNFAVERAGKKAKNNSLVVKDGKVYQNKNGELQEVAVAKGAAERITGMLEIRDAAKELIAYQQQGLKDSEIKKARQKLNKAYDAFVKKYGFINAPSNKNAIKTDPDSYSILALENWNPETKKAVKSDIFSKDTIAPNRTVTSAKDVAEGLIVSVNQTGGVDAALIAKLTGKTEADVIRELIDSRAVFKNRDGGLETAEVYLSGNVRAKLRDAEALAHMDSDYQKNVEALKAVMPEDVGYQDIFVNPGTPWIPNNVYSDFAAYMLGTTNSEWRQAVDVTRNKESGNFTVELKQAYLKSNSYNTQKWGTSRRTFLDLFDAMLNSKSVVVKNKDADGKSVIDQDATAAANEKVEAIQKEFQEWLWKDEARRTELATLYNETFNSIVTPKYNGDNLTVNGANAMKPLRQHQRDAVQRIISSGGNTLLAHKVGAGKTYEMAAAAMKLKELGLVKKPLFAVPKPLVAQWGNEFMDFFPTAKLLVAEASDFTATNRKIFANRIANGDYDAVIMSYEQFERLPISADFARELYQEQIDSVIRAIEEAKAEKGGKSLSVKDLEKKRKSLQTKIDKLTDSAKDEDNIEFEQLGVDSIFVDEAHNFKNLFYTTSMSNVSGLSQKDGAKRSFDLYTKVRYLQKLNGGRGIVFATATPVMNSMAEMYIMQKYLQPDLLDQLGLTTFDAWAKQFGEVVNGVEIKPSGQGYRVKQSFSRFKNMSELQLLFRNFADVLTDIPGLKIPKMKGGRVNVVVCEPGQFQKDYMKELEKRADNIKNVDPTEDNMLKITSDGRKISYTQRMIDPSLPYEEGCKIYRCADNVVRVYQESSAIKGTQLIFCDMATPKGKSKIADNQTEEIETDMENARLYDDIKARLMKGGIPAKEIAFIHEADTDAKKKKLFADVNDGKVRVLIGSTGKMGVGMNAQKRIAAIHHLDAPWRPGDVEQRNGRAYRQGNINEEVENFTYVTEGSFDARLWDILDRKQSFINQVMNGESVGRETEDTGEVTLSAAEVKALASGSPLIMEQVQLDTDIKKLESLRRAHRSAVTNALSRLQADKGRIATLEKMIENGKADVDAIVDTYSEGKFSITIGKQKFTEKKDAGVALMAEATAKANEDGYTTVAKFAGFDLRVIKTHEGIKGIISGKQGYSFKTYPDNTTYMINHLVARVQEIQEAVTQWEQELVQTQNDMAEQEKLIAQPFEKQAELDQKRARYNEVMEILNPKEEQSLDSVAEDDVQYQSREYLGYSYKNISQQEWRQIQEDRMAKYGGNFENMPGVDYTFAHDRMYIFENLDETHFRVFNSIDPAKNQAQINKALEVLKYGHVQTVSDYSRRIGNLRNFKKLYKGYSSDARYRGTDTGNAGLDTGTGGTSDGGGLLETGVGDHGKQYQQRTNTLTDREVLTLAASQVKVDDLTAAEKDALDIFQQRLSKLESLQAERAEQGRLYKEQQFGTKVDRAKAAETLNRMHVLDGQIQKASAEVLTVEEKTVLKRVLQKARTVVEQQERQHGKEILNRWRDRRNNADAIKKYRDRLRGDVDELTNWVLHPDNKNVVKHIPDALKNTVIPFLSSINFESKRSLAGGNPTQADKALMEQTRKLAKVMENTIDIDEMYSNYTDLPPDFMQNLRSFMDTAQDIIDSNSGDFIINQMTAEELQKLSKVVRTLKKYIMTMNRFHVNSMFKHVYEAGENSIDFLAELKPAENTGAVSQFLLWQQMRPAYAFERFGDGGMAVYDGLRRGQATLAFNTKKIIEFSEKAYTTAEVKAWENQVKTIRIGPGKTVTMRVSQIMSLYELNKREQAQGHILGEGIRVATFKNGKQKISDIGQTLTPGELNLILRELTPRQKEVADNLQQFMEKQGGEWGNYVTVARFGEKQFGEKNYFPINSDGRHLQVDADEKPGASALYALLNMSFTKQTQEKAKNRIVIYSIFDVFSNHMASMAQYNAFALPVVDALKWFNYQRVAIDDDGSKTILGSVREQMDRAYGVPEESRPGSGRKGYAQNFVINIIKAFNGTEAQGTPYDTWYLKWLQTYNRAQVAYNFRVVVQQPLAITRAALLLDYSSIMKGMKLQPAAIQRNIAEMQKHSGIAAWKSLGFYDVNISRGLTSLIKHDNTALDKITDVGMWGAEKADLWTWAAIWSASKEEVIRKQKLTPKSEGFYEAVTKLFEDVIYKTQVVDSVLTKNEFMRDKGFGARAVGSFMSEPTTTASMLIDAYDKYQMDMQRGMNRQQAWKNNSRMIVRTAYVYGIGALILAAVQAVADAFRDDDDYQEFMEKWLEAFGGNLVDELMPFNKLPIVNDFYDLAKELLSIFGVDTYGNPPQSVFMQWYDSLVKGVGILYDKISGEDTNYTWYGGAYKLLQAVSGITGLPMAAATREIVTLHNNAIVPLWNSTVGSMAPSLKVDKVKTYEPSELAQIKYAYQDGYLTDEEATQQLLQQGLADTENEAYFMIEGWEAGEGYSKYGAIFDAVRNDGDFNAAMRELTSHGYAEKDVLSQVKSQIGDWYKDGEITKQQTINMLTKYMDMDSEEITATVNKWSSKVVTGIAFEDIKDEFLQGNITAQRAIDMYVLYGGYTKDKATEMVNKWRAEKETGVAYDDIKDAFMSGEISQGDAKNMYITYGGYSVQEAAEKVAVLSFVKKYPECYGISYAAVESYQTHCETYRVPAGTFYDAWKYNSSTQADVDTNGESISGSKKVKVLAYINSLNLTYAQKDSLYYAFGWAESKISEAPWH